MLITVKGRFKLLTNEPLPDVAEMVADGDVEAGAVYVAVH